MTRRIVGNVMGVVLGVVVGMIVMMALHTASALVYPLPEGVDFASTDPETQARLNEWFATLPAGAFLLAIVAHGLGCMSGAAVAMLIAGRRSLLPAIVIGLFFTICGVLNLVSVPHPTWFPFVDLPVYMILALGAGLLLKREGSGRGSSNLSSGSIQPEEPPGRPH